MTLDAIAEEITAVTVEVLNPETPFGGVQIYGVSDTPIQVIFGPVAVEGGDGTEIPPTSNLLAGDGAGGVVDSGIDPDNIVMKQTSYPTPTTVNQVIACLQNAGLCA